MRTAIIAAIVAMLVSAASATAAFVVTSKNIKNGTIQLVDISPRAKAALRGQRGPRGIAGTFATATITTVEGSEINLCSTGGPSSCQIGASSATCPAGSVVISGGWVGSFDQLSGLDHASILASARNGTSGWSVGVSNNSPSHNAHFRAMAVCAS